MMKILLNDKKFLALEVSKKGALSLIKSLTSQLLADSPNVGRLEQRAGDILVTIAIKEGLK